MTRSREPAPDEDIRVSAAALAAVRFAAHTAPWRLGAPVVLTAGAAALPVVIALATKHLTDDLVVRDRDGATTAAIWLVAGGLLATLLPLVRRYGALQLGRRLSYRATDDLYRAVALPVGLARLEEPAFHDRVRLARQSGGETPAVITDGLLAIARCVTTAVGLVATIAVLSPVLAGVVVAGTVPVLLAELDLSRRRAATMWVISPAERREIFFGTLLTSLQAAKEIRLFELGDFLRHRMLSGRRRADLRRQRMDRRELAAQVGVSSLGAMATGGATLWVVWSVAAGRLSLGDLSLLLVSVGALTAAGTELASSLATTNQQALLYRHYLAVLREPSTPLPTRPTTGAPPLETGIEVRDVWFRYTDAGPWILRGASFTIPAGRSVALVGANGAGKSSLVKLLCRFYEPDRGAILWDGVDIRSIPPVDLRRRMTAVFQDYMEYDLTAAENIAVGDISALDDEARIRRAAHDGDIDPVLSALPLGYHTLLSRVFVGETDEDGTGGQLSGGQWQRLAVARALFRGDRDLMILDEPSSGLDAAAEHELHRRLHRLRAGRTSLLISHRLGAVRDADRIVVIEAGRVAEEGDHRCLLAAGGLYARMFELQASGYRQDAPATVAS